MTTNGEWIDEFLRLLPFRTINGRLEEQLEEVILQKLQEEYKRGYNDNARDCYCDSTKVIESLIPHKHLMDDGKSHDIRPDIRSRYDHAQNIAEEYRKPFKELTKQKEQV